MVRLTGNMATNAGVAICGGTAIYFPTSVNATESTAAGCGTADTTNSSGVFQCLTLAANKYDIRVNCGAAFRWSRYADEIQHATFQTGDGCPCGLEGNYYLGIGLDAGMRWSTADASNHALVVGVGDTSQQIHITDVAAMNTDWVRSAGTHPELAIHSNTTPVTDYLAIGNHDGTTATIDVVGGTTLSLDIAGNTELTVTSAGLNVPACSDINFTGTTGTNDIVLTNALADALSITDGSADILVFDTATAGNVITATAALTLSGDLAVNGGCITSTSALCLNPTTTFDITITDDRCDAFTIKNSATNYYRMDTRNTQAANTVHRFDTENAAIASTANAQYNLAVFNGYTITYSGCTNVTNGNFANVCIASVTVTAGCALTVSKTMGLRLAAHTEAGCVTITDAIALNIRNAGGTPTNQYGIYFETLCSGATADYGIYFGGASGTAEIGSAAGIKVHAASGSTVDVNLLGFGTAGSLTIATGVVAVTQTYHTLVVEGGACMGADALVTATGGAEGDVLILKGTSSGACNTITITNGTGADTFILCGGADFSMDHTDDRLTLLHNGTEWVQIAESNGS